MNKWIKVGTNASMAYEEMKEADEGTYTTSTPISASRLMLSYWNPYRADGSYTQAEDGSWIGSNVNPLEWQAANRNKTNKWKVVATAFAEWKPIQGLTFKTLGGLDFLDQRSDNSTLPSFVVNQGEGAIARDFSRSTNLTLSNTPPICLM